MGVRELEELEKKVYAAVEQALKRYKQGEEVTLRWVGYLREIIVSNDVLFSVFLDEYGYSIREAEKIVDEAFEDFDERAFNIARPIAVKTIKQYARENFGVEPKEEDIYVEDEDCSFNYTLCNGCAEVLVITHFCQIREAGFSREATYYLPVKAYDYEAVKYSEYCCG